MQPVSGQVAKGIWACTYKTQDTINYQYCQTEK